MKTPIFKFFLFLSLLFFTYGYFGDVALFLIAPFLIALINPLLAYSILAFSIPLFGNKPATPQSIVLTLTALSIVIGSFKIQKIPALLKLYGLTAFCSLITYSTVTAFYELGATFTIQEPYSFIIGFFELLTAGENSKLYPLLTALQLNLGVLIATQVIALKNENKRIISYLSIAIFLGFLSSVIFGLLDYFQIISLLPLRALDPNVNPGGGQWRLQSFFGHSGWFAEYLTISAPFVLLLLGIKRFGIVFVIVSLVLGEAALILSYQRGGWVSYPLTLIVVWFVYYSSTKEASLKKVLIKTAVSIPLTVMLTLGALSLIRGTSGEIFDLYSSRFKDITKTSDRTDFIMAGLKIWSLSPVFGAGSESFFLEYEREFLNKDGKFINEITLPFHGSAHNLYAQILAGRGIVGLLSFLWLVVFLTINLSRSLKNNEDKLIKTATISFFIALLIYGFVQELFYIQTLQVLFFLVVGLSYRLLPSTSEEPRLKYLYPLLVLFMGIHLLTKRTVGVEPFGCYGFEEDQEGKVYQWCKPTALIIKPNFNVALGMGGQGGILRFPEGADKAGESFQVFEAWEQKGFTQSAPSLVISNNAFIPVGFAAKGDKRVLGFRVIQVF